jgi:excisionase family DNA binding protein
MRPERTSSDASAEATRHPFDDPDQPDGYLLVSEAAEILHVSPKTICRWALEGKLPYQKTLGGHRRYPARVIRELAASLHVQPS